MRSPLRRSLWLAFVLGCTVSSLASGRFSVRLILDGAVSFAFVPIFEAGAFAAVYWLAKRRDARRSQPFATAFDAFLAGNTPWLLWLVGLAALAGVVPPRDVAAWILPVGLSAFVPTVWSAVIDLRFFRRVMGRSDRHAVIDVALTRAISWTAATIYFLGLAIWAETPASLLRLVRL